MSERVIAVTSSGKQTKMISLSSMWYSSVDRLIKPLKSSKVIYWFVVVNALQQNSARLCACVCL